MLLDKSKNITMNKQLDSQDCLEIRIRDNPELMEAIKRAKEQIESGELLTYDEIFGTDSQADDPEAINDILRGKYHPLNGKPIKLAGKSKSNLYD